MASLASVVSRSLRRSALGLRQAAVASAIQNGAQVREISPKDLPPRNCCENAHKRG